MLYYSGMDVVQPGEEPHTSPENPLSLSSEQDII